MLTIASQWNQEFWLTHIWEAWLGVCVPNKSPHLIDFLWYFQFCERYRRGLRIWDTSLPIWCCTTVHWGKTCQQHLFSNAFLSRHIFLPYYVDKHVPLDFVGIFQKRIWLQKSRDERTGQWVRIGIIGKYFRFGNHFSTSSIQNSSVIFSVSCVLRKVFYWTSIFVAGFKKFEI